jgi:glycosyltransferase involved in cell wall biosynthesis
MTGKPRVVVVTGWWKPDSLSLFGSCQKLLQLLSPLCDSVMWLGTNLVSEIPRSSSVTSINIGSKYIAPGVSPFKLVPLYLAHQLKLLMALLKLLAKSDIFVFAFGSDLYVLPMLLVRMAGKKVVLRSDGRPSLVLQIYFQRQSRLKIELVQVAETICYRLAHKLLPESEFMIDLYNLKQYSKKIASGSQYIDTSTFRKTRKVAERTYGIGFIGRLTREKGCLEFVNSLPSILRKKSCKVIIIGDGEQRGDIIRLAKENGVFDSITFLDWLDQKQIPHYLNQIKIVNVPSYQEGLSNLVLEAMACGSIVVANQVGSTPAVVKDSVTGFLMENNSPECIAKNIIRAMTYPDLEKISENAQTFILQKYAFDVTLARYKKVFASL